MLKSKRQLTQPILSYV